MTGQDLADRLGRTKNWAYRRLAGHARITLDDLDDMCGELELQPVISFRPARQNRTTAGRSTGRRSRTPNPPVTEGSE